MKDSTYRSIVDEGVTRLVPDCFEFRGAITARNDGGSTTQLLYTHTPTGMEFVLIPGGVGEIGCRSGSLENRPRHQIHVPAFLLSRHPVTLGVWRDVMEKEIPDKPWSPDRVPVSHFGDSYPVADVSALQCDAFCQRTGLELPSEAEWEYACRAGQREDYVRDLSEYAWFAGNSNEVQPVGLKGPNSFGLYDMLGNVWEWCADTWHETYAGAPTDATVWVDATSENRVARGGSVEHDAEACQPFVRMYWPPDMTGSCAGLRVKSSLKTQGKGSSDVPRRPRVVPDGFKSLGERACSHNGVVYKLDWISHLETGLELPLLPGGLYQAESFPELWNRVCVLFTENVIVTKKGTSHPELLNSLVERRGELYPVLVERFLTSGREIRGFAAFWHGELSTAMLRAHDDLPEAMPSAEVFAAALEESDAWIRAMAASTFGGFLSHSQPFLPALILLLGDTECCEVVLQVFRDLGGCANEVLPHIVSVALHHDHLKIRDQAAETIKWLSEHGAYHGHISEDARSSAIDPLLSLVAVEGFPSAAAAQALVLLDYDKARLIPVLIELLDSDDLRARQTAAKSLAVIGAASGPLARAALEERADDPDPSVREAVAFALRRMSE